MQTFRLLDSMLASLTIDNSLLFGRALYTTDFPTRIPRVTTALYGMACLASTSFGSLAYLQVCLKGAGWLVGQGRSKVANPRIPLPTSESLLSDQLPCAFQPGAMPVPCSVFRIG
jgi:hypothetical protein